MSEDRDEDIPQSAGLPAASVAVLLRLSEVLSAAASLGDVAAHVPPLARSVVGADFAVIGLHERDGEHPRYLESDVPAGGFAVRVDLPLVVEGRVLGVLGIAWHDEHRLSAAEQEALEALAGFTAQTVSRLLVEQERTAAAERLAALADAALHLSRAQSVEDLSAIVLDRTLASMGAGGGAIAVRRDDGLAVTTTASFGEAAREHYVHMRLDGPLPSSVTAVSGQRVLLPDLAACLVWGSSMAKVVEDSGCEAWACLPLQVDGRLLGSLAVGWSRPHAFPPAEVDVLEALAAQCAYGLERIAVHEAELASATAARRMSEVLQRSLLTDPVQPDRLRIAARYRPAARDAQVGGDWYDAFLTRSGDTCLVIGDVSGHDRWATATMGQVRNLLRGVAYTVNDPPAAVLATLDHALVDLAVGSLVTAVLAKVELAPGGAAAGGHRLRWCNAGHPPPILVGRDGVVQVLSAPADLLLGLDPDTARVDHERTLEPGATVLLYTDGLVERRGASLSEGVDWLAGALGALAGLPLEALCDALLDQVGEVEDDIALLALCTQG